MGATTPAPIFFAPTWRTHNFSGQVINAMRQARRPWPGGAIAPPGRDVDGPAAFRPTPGLVIRLSLTG